MSTEIPNRLLAAASIIDRAISGQSGFVGNPGDSILVAGTVTELELVFSPDTRIEPDRLLVCVSPANVRSVKRFLGFGSNDRLHWDWPGTEAQDAFDFDVLVYQLAHQAVR